MAEYEAYLKGLLAPLRVYDLSAGTNNESELAALGHGLDGAAEALAAAEREGMLASAEDAGLSRREALFARRPAAPTTALRRAAIAALLQISGDSLTPESIQRTIAGCGIRARAEEVDTGHLRISFPDTAGEPEDYARIKAILLDILPCHLAVEFYLRYLTWQECETQNMTFASIEDAGYTWNQFQMAVAPEA